MFSDICCLLSGYVTGNFLGTGTTLDRGRSWVFTFLCRAVACACSSPFLVNQYTDLQKHPARFACFFYLLPMNIVENSGADCVQDRLECSLLRRESPHRDPSITDVKQKARCFLSFIFLKEAHFFMSEEVDRRQPLIN